MPLRFTDKDYQHAATRAHLGDTGRDSRILRHVPEPVPRPCALRLKAQREVLRRQVAGLRRTSIDAEQKFTEAQRLANSGEFGSPNARYEIERQQRRLHITGSRLKSAEAVVALFDLIHANDRRSR